MIEITEGMIPGLVLTTLLPGFLLAKALLPHERVRDPLGFAKFLVLSIAFSISITSVVGVILGFLPHGSTGFFTAPFVGMALVAVSAVLFEWGRRRGAYTRRHAPSQSELPAESPAAPGSDETFFAS